MRQPGLFSLYLIQPELQTLCQMCPMIVLVSFCSRSSSLHPFHLRSRYQTQVPLLPPLLFQGPCDWSGDASDLIPDSRGGARSEKLFFRSEGLLSQGHWNGHWHVQRLPMPDRDSCEILGRETCPRNSSEVTAMNSGSLAPVNEPLPACSESGRAAELATSRTIVDGGALGVKPRLS